MLFIVSWKECYSKKDYNFFPGDSFLLITLLKLLKIEEISTVSTWRIYEFLQS